MYYYIYYLKYAKLDSHQLTPLYQSLVKDLKIDFAYQQMFD